MAQEILREYGERVTREEYERLARAFRSAVVPKRKAGRRRKPQVTAAYLDWKAGMKGVELFRKHLAGWDRHNRYHRIGEQKELMDAIRSRYRRERDKHPTATQSDWSGGMAVKQTVVSSCTGNARRDESGPENEFKVPP